MPWYKNSFGSDVHLNRSDILSIEKRGDMHLFQPRSFRDDGFGPRNRIAVIFASNNGSNGIGDYVHAMPALAAKVRAGFECHVYTTEFFRPFVEWCGATYHDCSQLGVGSLFDMKQRYGAIYSLIHWCVEHDEQTFGDVWKPRFQQIADFIGAELPTKYEWPFRRLWPTCLVVALRSTGRPRSYELDRSFSGIRDAATQYGLELLELGGNNAHKESWMVEAATLVDLIAYVASAAVVIATDNGILALALAMGIPCIAVFGPTDEHTIIWQFSRYVNTDNVRVVRSAKADAECQRPCSMQQERGFEREIADKLKCKWHGSEAIMSDCLAEIAPEQIVSELTNLLAHVSTTI